MVKPFDEGSDDRKFGHAIVAGIDRYPRRVGVNGVDSCVDYNTEYSSTDACFLLVPSELNQEVLTHRRGM